MFEIQYPTLQELGIDPPDISHIEIEDGAPVDGLPSEREMHLMMQPLYVTPDVFTRRDFFAASNVGIFYALNQPPIVPDVFVSLDVKHPGDLHLKQNQTYMVWEYGKVPDVVVEIVSNKKGGELGKKKIIYARIRIPYYVVHDPYRLIGKKEVHVFELRGDKYEELSDQWLPGIGLGVTVWEDAFEGLQGRWLRWCDIDGTLLPTGTEAAEQSQQTAQAASQRAHTEFERAENALELVEEERQRAEKERQRAEKEHQRAERLTEKLRALGIEPDEL